MRSLILAAALTALSLPAAAQQKCAPRDVALAGGITCMVADGQAWQMRPFAPAVPDDPA